jgi:xanthine dehydrogenase accessory factor
VRSDALARRAEELAAQGAAFVTATVVRAQRPTSARAGNVALVLGDATIEGFVGGACAEHSVRQYAMKAMKSGEPLLLRILPTDGDDFEGEQQEIKEDGAVTVQNTCLSGGAIEVFLEPVLPAPRVHVVGSTPIAAALERSGSELGLDVVAAYDSPPDLQEGDLGIIVAAHGKGELDALRRGLEAKLPYVGLVASPRRGAGLVEELRADGVSHARGDRAVDSRADHPDPPGRRLRAAAEGAEDRVAAAVRGRPDLRDDGHGRAEHAARRARRRDGLLLLRRLQDEVPAGAHGCRRRGLTPS